MQRFFLIFTKWLPAAILDNRKSLSIAFLTFDRIFQNGRRRPYWIPIFAKIDRAPSIVCQWLHQI